MNKIYAFLLIFCLALPLAGCDGLVSAPPEVIEDVLPGGSAALPPDESPELTLPAEPALGQAVAGRELPQTGGTALNEADGVTLREALVYYPEGSTAANAIYSLSYSLPVFGGSFPGAEELNAAVSLYEEELMERVQEERIPFADAPQGEPPATSVAAYAERAGDFVNIFLTELVSFGHGTECNQSVMVFDSAGARQSLASYTGVYEPTELAAQQVFNVMDADRGSYFGDLSMEDISAALDLYSGFFATPEGCGLMVGAGVLAPEEKGPLAFFIPKAAFYPACVGDVITAEEYGALLPALNALVAACAVDYAEFTGSAPGAYTASAFLTRLFTTGEESEYYLAVDKAQYVGLYSDYFTGPLPADLYTAGDGAYEEGGSVMVPVYPHGAYSLRIDDAVRQDGRVILYGMIQFGVPGTADAGELTSVSVTLAPSDTAPAGYTFESLMME